MTGGMLFEPTAEMECHVVAASSSPSFLCCVAFLFLADFTVADDVAMIAPIIVSIANRFAE